MFGGKFGSRSLEKSFHVEGRPVARPVHRPNFDAAEGNRSRISAMSRIRATVSTLKRERVLKMKLPTEIRALFSQGVGCFPYDELNPPGFNLFWG